MGILRAVTDALAITKPTQPSAEASGQKPTTPGWYQHPEMVNTLCYWDGNAWTDKVQPMPQDTEKAVERGVAKVVGSLIAIAIIIWLAYAVITANDDLDCATRNADHATQGEPAEDC